jgi:hypothetical protein
MIQQAFICPTLLLIQNTNNLSPTTDITQQQLIIPLNNTRYNTRYAIWLLKQQIDDMTNIIHEQGERPPAAGGPPTEAHTRSG